VIDSSAASPATLIKLAIAPKKQSKVLIPYAPNMTNIIVKPLEGLYGSNISKAMNIPPNIMPALIAAHMQ